MIKNYKNYSCDVYYDQEAQLYHGTVANITDSISFEGKNIKELEQEFREAVDDYLAWCKELGEEPEEPNEINLWVLLPREIHEQLSAEAQSQGISFNVYAKEKLIKSTEEQKDTSKRKTYA